MQDTDLARERKLRHALDRFGYRLAKTPARSWLRSYYGPGYMVLDGNTAIFGCCSRGYEATLDEVEAWFSDGAASPYRENVA